MRIHDRQGRGWGTRVETEPLFSQDPQSPPRTQCRACHGTLPLVTDAEHTDRAWRRLILRTRLRT